MTRLLYHIATWCARHAILVIVVWLLLLAGLSGLDKALPPPGQQVFSLSGTDSSQALTLMNRAFPGTASDSAPLLLAGEESLRSGENQQQARDVRRAVADLDEVARAEGPGRDPDNYSPDERIAVVRVTMVDRYVGDPTAAREILDTARAAAPDLQVALGGLLGNSISTADTSRSERLGVFAAIIVLMLTLRRAWAAAIPLLNAMATVGVGIAVIGLLGRVVLIPDVAPTLGMMLGLGVGIDYALFLVTRQRSLLRQGYEPIDAAGRTAGTSGAGITFAGITLMLAVSGLALTGIEFLAWMGFAAAIVVGIAVIAATTLVPAILGLLGRRVLRKRNSDAHVETDDHLDHGFWARISDRVTTKPWLFAGLSTLLLLVMAAPMLTMSFGQTDAGDLPKDTTAYQANQLLVEAFGPGSTGPLLIVAQLNRPAAAPDDSRSGTADPQARSGADSAQDPRTGDPRLEDLTDTLTDTPGIESVSPPFVSPGGGVAAVRVTPTTGPADPATSELIGHLREDVLPQVAAGADMTLHVGGATALFKDMSGVIGQRLPYFILGVVTLSGLLLMVAYRSLVIPVKAAAMNLLSISAAYGVVVAIFEWGWGASLIGLDELVPIDTFIPMMMFAILFGLSMDYEVFLLTAFREHWAKTGDMTTSVRRGLADTGQVITSAATIMVVVFASFLLVPDPIIKMFGVGLATAILVDATIVRILLVPALMVLAARWTWWLPGWLERSLPELHVEGDPTALDSIETGPEPEPAASRSVPAVALLAVVGGVAAAWLIGARISPDLAGSQMQDAAAAITVIAGGLAVWLPTGLPGAGRSAPGRVIMLLLGTGAMVLIFASLQSLIPSTVLVPGQTAGFSMLLLAVLVVATPVRGYGIPVILGGLAMTATVAVSSSAGTPDLVELLTEAALPPAIAGFIAILLDRLFFPKDTSTPGVAGQGPRDRATPADRNNPTERDHGRGLGSETAEQPEGVG